MRERGILCAHMRELSSLSLLPTQRLYTPGPLSTTPTVKAAMLRDLGSRHASFLRIVSEIRSEILELAGVDREEWAVLPLPGSGTYGLEAVLGNAVSEEKCVLIIANGAYGDRLAQIAAALCVEHLVLRFPESKPFDSAKILSLIQDCPQLTHLAVVQCETSTGQVNDLRLILRLAQSLKLSVIVDAMSSFGAVPLDLGSSPIDYLVTSPNKCLQGVPGCSLLLLRRSALYECSSRSYSLDLGAHLSMLDSSGQFRFTPPTHALLALHQALRELRQEGGPAKRYQRYKTNAEVLGEGMSRLGFVPLFGKEHLSPIISSFFYPDDPAFSFPLFCHLLSERGFVIYPGKLSTSDCFRIGTIGNLFPSDMTDLVSAIEQVLQEMKVAMPTRGTPSPQTTVP